MRLVNVTSIAVLLWAGTARAQEPPARILEPFRLLEPKSVVARRASSNNDDLASNDDSKRPIPGETVVLADLEGPGVVTHLWITVADNEYGWPRLLACARTTTAPRFRAWTRRSGISLRSGTASKKRSAR